MYLSTYILDAKDRKIDIHTGLIGPGGVWWWCAVRWSASTLMYDHLVIHMLPSSAVNITYIYIHGV